MSKIETLIEVASSEYFSHEQVSDAATKALPEIHTLLHQNNGLMQECHEVKQSLGKALGYPWYKDDPKNFPGATERDGVCTAERSPASIANEAASRIVALVAERDALRELVVHMRIHEGYPRNGYSDMTTEQKALCEKTIEDGVS